MRDKTEITIDRGTGLAWRDGKILGRRNWEVHTETTISIKERFVVKAASEDEAMQKGVDIAERKHKKDDPNCWVEIGACFTDG
mgnify:FL=1|tara:strand:+ start:95 stop:343 length:249 start_codon:yes stop_codon:yes gene_type:complete